LTGGNNTRIPRVLREDPAERGYLRFFYRDWRPTRLGRIWSRAWVQDVWAANGAAFLKAGHIRPVVLTEIPPHERAPIIKAWCQAATSGRRHLSIPFDAPVSAFETITADYPVFRVDPVR
jgi:hypothetical protein